MTLSHGEKEPPISEVCHSTLSSRVRKLLGFVQSTRKWHLTDGKPLDRWVHESGRVTLLGDACHPILVRCIADLLLVRVVDVRSQPFRAQGAAMAIEDAAVLGNLLSRISHLSQLKPLLKAYQDLRLRRTAVAQESSRFNRGTFSLPDGPEQRERDEKMRRAMALELSDNSGASGRESDGDQERWGDKEKNDVLFGYDADDEVEKWWAAHGRKLEVEVFVRPRL